METTADLKKEILSFGDNIGKVKALLFEAVHLIKHGFTSKKIVKNKSYPNSVSHSTVGLERSYDHPNFQVCIPMAKNKISECFDHLVAQIKKGRKFQPGQTYDGFQVNGHPIQFIEVVAFGRKQLRILFSDRNGKMDHAPFSGQLKKTHDGSKLNPIYYDPADITNSQDVVAFMHALYEVLDFNFHPKAAFRHYHYTGSLKKLFTPKQAIRLELVYAHCQTIKGGKVAMQMTRKTYEGIRKGAVDYLKSIKPNVSAQQPPKISHEYSYKRPTRVQRRNTAPPALKGNNLKKHTGR